MCEKVGSVLNVKACGIYNNDCASNCYITLLPLAFEENNSPTFNTVVSGVSH
jgi:hypothetical protein